MGHLRWYSALLAVLLIGSSWLGNASMGDPHLVTAFSGAMDVLAFPLVLYPALRRRARERPCTVGALQRAGWGVVWPASIAFAVAVAAFVAYRFSRPTLSALALGFASSLVLSMVLGWLFVNLCVLVLRRWVAASPADAA